MSDDPRAASPWRAVLPVAGLAAVVAVWVAMHISSDIPMDSDEANHANIALRQYQDLAGGHLMDFVRHSYRTGQFPFFHGWMQLPVMAVLGPTLFAVRVTQCLLFVLGAAATAWAGFRAGGDRRAAGLLAGSLFALSPALAGYAALCMLETPGAATTALSLAVFSEAVRWTGRRRRLLHVAVAVAVLATYFTKLNYGLWIAPAVAAGYVVAWWRAGDRRAVLADALVYLGTLLVVAVVWYATAAQRQAFLGFLHNPAEKVPVVRDDPAFHVPGLSLSNLTAYFGLVAGGFHVLPALGWGVLGAFVVGLSPRRLLASPLRTVAAACLLWTWLVLSMEFRQYTMERFIASALPCLWVVAAAAVADLLPERPLRKGEAIIPGAAVIGLLGALLITLPDRIRAEYEVDARFAPVFTFIEETVPAPASLAVVNYTDHVSARTLVWELATAREGGSYRVHDVKAFIAERRYESAGALESWLVEDRRWGGDDWESCIVEFQPGRQFHDAAVIVWPTVAMYQGLLRSLGDRLELVDRRRFEDLDLTVTVWRDRRPPPHLGLGAR